MINVFPNQASGYSLTKRFVINEENMRSLLTRQHLWERGVAVIGERPVLGH